jgi:hypothetical protein
MKAGHMAVKPGGRTRKGERFRLSDLSRHTDSERLYRREIGLHFDQSAGTTLDKLNHFPRFVPRQSLSLFLARQEAFRQALDVQGSIVECGVFFGGGLFTWAQLSAIFEPANHLRKIIGFDSFSGFPAIGDTDLAPGEAAGRFKRKGAYAYGAVAELQASMRLYDLNRSIGHVRRIEIVCGDATQTIPDYVRQNEHLVVALLHLDFDLYDPTRCAIETFLPRMPRGAILAFDELNQREWPGETRAVLETCGIRNLRIRRLPFAPAFSYAILE